MLSDRVYTHHEPVLSLYVSVYDTVGFEKPRLKRFRLVNRVMISAASMITKQITKSMILDSLPWVDELPGKPPDPGLKFPISGILPELKLLISGLLPELKLLISGMLPESELPASGILPESKLLMSGMLLESELLISGRFPEPKLPVPGLLPASLEEFELSEEAELSEDDPLPLEDDPGRLNPLLPDRPLSDEPSVLSELLPGVEEDSDPAEELPVPSVEVSSSEELPRLFLLLLTLKFPKFPPILNCPIAVTSMDEASTSVEES